MLAWQTDAGVTITESEALNLYERGWRHLDQEALTDHEKAFIQHLAATVSYTHLRAHETVLDLVCRLLLANKHTTLNTTS